MGFQATIHGGDLRQQPRLMVNEEGWLLLDRRRHRIIYEAEHFGRCPDFLWYQINMD
jgi:hypothetical protein